MKRCLYSKCRKDFEPKINKAVYCSDNCRKYANKEKIASLGTNSNDIQWVVLVNGTKIKYEEKNMELILSKLGVRSNVINRHNEPNEIIPKVVDEKPKIKTIDPYLESETIVDENVEQVDYERLFAECVYPEEVKKISDMMKLDKNVPLSLRNNLKVLYNLK